MLKEQLQKNLREFVALGPRASGSSAELRAAEFIKAKLESYGLNDVAIETFPSASHCTLDSTLIHLESGNKFTSQPAMFSPGGSCVGELIFIGTCHSSYVDNVADLSGKIGLLTPSGSFQERIDFILDLERRGLEALIIVSPGLDMINSKVIRYPEIKRLPSLCVSWRTACQLKRLVGQKFSLQINTENINRHESVNVVAKLRGKSANWLLLSAHIDTAPYTVGANDNASGVAVLLEHARQLAAGEMPEATVYLLFSGSEEYGALDCCGVGAKAFYQTRQAELSTCIAHLEIDDVGDPLHPQKIMLGGSKKFIDIFRNLKIQIPCQIIEKYLPSCDHGSAIQHGIPFAFFGNKAPEVPVYHTPGDSLEVVDINAMAEAFKISKKCIDIFSRAKPFFPYIQHSKLLIRPAYFRDLEEIKNITRRAFEPVSLDRMAEDYFNTALGGREWYEYKCDSVETQCRSNIYNVIVAETAAHVVGYATMLLDYQRGIAEIGNNAVHPDFQGRGIGKAMQQEIMRRMIESGFEKFKVNTLSNDIAAQKVYEKLGFEQIMTGIYYLKNNR